jgi:hypothetical protein
MGARRPPYQSPRESRSANGPHRLLTLTKDCDDQAGGRLRLDAEKRREARLVSARMAQNTTMPLPALVLAPEDAEARDAKSERSRRSSPGGRVDDV